MPHSQDDKTALDLAEQYKGNHAESVKLLKSSRGAAARKRQGKPGAEPLELLIDEV